MQSAGSGREHSPDLTDFTSAHEEEKPTMKTTQEETGPTTLQMACRT